MPRRRAVCHQGRRRTSGGQEKETPPVVSRGRFLVKGLTAALALLASDVSHRAKGALLPLDQPGLGEPIKGYLGLAG